MTTDTHTEREPAPHREDARGLIARLCRELGVAAVADALREPENRTSDLAPVLELQISGDRIAA